MAKKLLCVIVLMLALVCVLASCGHEHEFGEWEITEHPTHTLSGTRTRTCSCGETETNNDLPPVENHAFENGECSICGEKVFDVLKAYIKEKGVYDSGSYDIVLGDWNTDIYTGYLRYNPSDDTIDFINNYHTMPGEYSQYLHAYQIVLTLTKYTFEDGGYDYTANCIMYPCDYPRLSGKFDPSKFSKSSTELSHSSTSSEANLVVKGALSALRGNFDTYYKKILKDAGLSFEALGFARYN